MRCSEIDEHDHDLVDALIDILVLHHPIVRFDLVAAARARLAEGQQPTAFDLAGTLVAHFA